MKRTILAIIVFGSILYWSISEMSDNPEPSWIEEPSDDLMDYKVK